MSIVFACVYNSFLSFRCVLMARVRWSPSSGIPCAVVASSPPAVSCPFSPPFFALSSAVDGPLTRSLAVTRIAVLVSCIRWRRCPFHRFDFVFSLFRFCMSVVISSLSAALARSTALMLLSLCSLVFSSFRVTTFVRFLFLHSLSFRRLWRTTASQHSAARWAVRLFFRSFFLPRLWCTF